VVPQFVTREKGRVGVWLSTFDRRTCVGSRWVGEQIKNIRWEQTLQAWASAVITLLVRRGQAVRKAPAEWCSHVERRGAHKSARGG
jgi:hypothetical protein